MRYAVLVVTLLGPAWADRDPAPPIIARADLRWPDPTRRDRFTVSVPASPARWMPGRYVLVDATGFLAEVTRVRDSGQNDQCPVSAAFDLAGKPDHAPHGTVVVVGPLPAPAPKARLMRVGVGLAGQPVAAREPLGVDPPTSAEPTFAVDLDGDGVADLATTVVQHEGPPTPGASNIRNELNVWRRHDKTWTATTRCEFATFDLLDDE